MCSAPELTTGATGIIERVSNSFEPTSAPGQLPGLFRIDDMESTFFFLFFFLMPNFRST
jgi:hypothetical protein